MRWVALRLRFEESTTERAFLDDYANGDRTRHALLWASLSAVALVMRVADPAVGMPEGLRVIRAFRESITVPGALAVAAWAMVPSSVWRKTWQVVTQVGYIVCFGNAVLIQFALERWGIPITTAYFQFACTVLSVGTLIVYSTMSLRVVDAAIAATVPAAAQVTFLLLHPPASTAVTNYMVFWMMAVVSFGAVAGHTIERLRRLDYRRRRQLEEARARTEAVLTAEVRHQVAERSRQLGDVLARSDAEWNTPPISVGHSFEKRYTIVKQIGQGGMGAVYEVRRLADERRLALKVIAGRVTSDAAARFAREAEIGARMRHDNLVPILDVGIVRGAPYLVMDFLGGGSLEARRARFGDKTWARTILRQVARGLHALHEGGVVHRDLKPANVLFVDDGDSLKIGDFGISRIDSVASPQATDPAQATADSLVATPPLTVTSAIIGTPMYMAPECIRGARAIQAPADVFAFGLIAYELVSGRAPFTVPPFSAALAGERAWARPLGDDEHDDWILPCLDPIPEKRPTTADLVRRLSSPA
jgi:hypothetical protein